MEIASLFECDKRHPLDLRFAETAAPALLSDLRALSLEFTSRGDRVPARVLLPPDGKGPFPLILLQHGAGGSLDSDYLHAAAGPWVRGGAAVASLDFPLHGSRSSPKLSAVLAGALTHRDGTNLDHKALWIAFVRQAVSDLRRLADALEGRPEIDATRIAYAAFSLGSILGSVFCATDPRPRAAALALGGGGFGPDETDPVRHIASFSPRPLLFVNASQDETVPRAAAEALHAAAGDPKEIVWFDTSHGGLRGVALKAMWQFLSRELSL